jgi:hypothetical protein
MHSGGTITTIISLLECKNSIKSELHASFHLIIIFTFPFIIDKQVKFCYFEYMKKIVSIVCLVLLLIATSNLAVTIHFCGNEIASIDFYGNTSNCGGACDSKTVLKEKSCCKNFTAVITTDDSTTTTFSFQCEQASFDIVPITNYLFVHEPIIQSTLKSSISCNAPPNVFEQPYYILYRSLII